MEWKFFEISWELLLTVACGYAGYFVANVGARAHHKTIDVTFSTIVYGFFGTAVYLIILAFNLPLWLATIGAFLGSMISAGIWAAKLRNIFTKVLRIVGVSHTDDLPSALASMFTDKTSHSTQLSVRLTSGVWLMCNDLARFKEAPNGPCVLGSSGDVLMYVTHHREPDGDYEECEVDVAGWGMELTYVPASQVARIDLRKKKPTSS
ncbi:hypothetical protein [Rhizobium sp. GR12]|uniref:hypothetical protein n=1 Tax=Rhizobium sp. GR12 TaxID=3053925 RepID=UPI002FBEDE14